MTPLKLLLHTDATITQLQFGCSGTQIYNHENGDEGPGQSRDNLLSRHNRNMECMGEKTDIWICPTKRNYELDCSGTKSIELNWICFASLHGPHNIIF